MSFEARVSVPQIKEEFTITANCASCRDKTVSEINELIEECGPTIMLHSIRQINPEQAVITDISGNRVNAAPTFDRC